MRDIDHILFFRDDLSPFLTHLCRRLGEGWEADRNLHKILRERRLQTGDPKISDARFGIYTQDWDTDRQKRFFSAVCFTETPLNEIHCLLEINYRRVDLEPFGLVFLRDRLKDKGVGPALHFNNVGGQMDAAIHGLCSLVQSHPHVAENVLPLIKVFGQKVTAPGAATQTGVVDFNWEREWRLPHARSPFEFTVEDVFIGLCPHDRIREFEAAFPPCRFVDPRRNMKWYATKLVESRQRLDIKFSVV